MKFVEFFYNRIMDVFEWFRAQDTRVVFGAAVVLMLILRALGFASMAVFLALVYIMWFVSVGRR